MNFPDELGCEQLSNFFVYGCVTFRVEFSSLLNDGFVRRIHVEPVDYDQWVDSRHVLMRPSEDVLILSEEADELVSEASRQLRSRTLGASRPT